MCIERPLGHGLPSAAWGDNRLQTQASRTAAPECPLEAAPCTSAPPNGPDDAFPPPGPMTAAPSRSLRGTQQQRPRLADGDGGSTRHCPLRLPTGEPDTQLSPQGVEQTVSSRLTDPNLSSGATTTNAPMCPASPHGPQPSHSRRGGGRRATCPKDHVSPPQHDPGPTGPACPPPSSNLPRLGALAGC